MFSRITRPAGLWPAFCAIMLASIVIRAAAQQATRKSNPPEIQMTAVSGKAVYHDLKAGDRLERNCPIAHPWVQWTKQRHNREFFLFFFPNFVFAVVLASENSKL